jgi:nitrogen regulatory protein PII
MKEIEFIINGNKLGTVKQILSAYSSNGVFITQGYGYGHQHGMRQVYTRDDSNQGVNLLPKVSVRTVVSDDLVDPIVDEAVASLGNAMFGDGKIFVREVAQAIRVRTDERGDEAL